MSIFSKLFKQGGDDVGSLKNITDHPKIGVPLAEYQRIQNNLQFFEGAWPNIKYKNTYGMDQKRPYVGLNMSKVVVKRMASIIFNEKMTFKIDEALGDANDWAQDFMNKNNFNKAFEGYLESGLATGGLAMRPYVDSNSHEMKIAWIQAPSFYPLRSNTGDISEAAIATKTIQQEGGQPVYYTLLEFHEWGSEGKYIISNELYKSYQSDTVGERIWLGSLYPGLPNTVEMSGLTRPLFTYFKPAGFNNKDITSPLGLSIYDNATETLRQLNDTHDMFNWEIRMGKRKVAVSEKMTRLQINPATGTAESLFETEQDVYLGVRGESDEPFVQDLTSPMRVDDFIKTLNNELKTLEMQVGLSAGSFSFDTNGLKTATEVVSENSMTYQTRNSHITMVERTIKELIISAMELAKSTVSAGSYLYDGEVPTLDDISISFDDGIFVDKSAQLDWVIKAKAAGLISDRSALMKLYSLNEEQAQDMLNEIALETSASTPLMPNEYVWWR